MGNLIEVVCLCLTSRPIALITDTVLSPAYPYADVVFQSDTNSGSYFPCYTGCITLIDAICRAVSSNSNINTDDHIRQMERRLLNHKIFIWGIER